MVTALVVAALLAVGLATGGSDDSSTAPSSGHGGKQEAGQKHRQRQKPVPAGHSLLLATNGEVWVCLLDSSERPLLNGVILAPGESEGPFRSGSFSIALGNGAVTMTVDGKQAKLPQPSSPIGFEVRSNGSVHELPEGERPTCT